MAKSLKLLLTENVDNLGIVGDVVTVRTGYARNFLLPRDLATQPSDDKIKELAGRRAEAERLLADLRTQREQMIQKLAGVEVTLIRSCNDMGHLYGAVTQQDISSALNEKGFAVKPRDVRLHQAVKRIDTYDVHVKLDTDLDTTVKLWVVADRKLDLSKAGEGEASIAAASAHAPAAAEPKDEAPKGAFRPAKGAEAKGGEAPKPEGKRAEAKKNAEHAAKGDKGDKPAKAEKAERPAKGDEPKGGKPKGEKPAKK